MHYLTISMVSCKWYLKHTFHLSVLSVQLEWNVTPSRRSWISVQHYEVYMCWKISFSYWIVAEDQTDCRNPTKTSARVSETCVDMEKHTGPPLWWSILSVKWQTLARESTAVKWDLRPRWIGRSTEKLK